jgi:cytochrome c oxidase subunit 2
VLFVERGCGACHAVRGTGSRGLIGPDLTHVARRPTLAAGALPNDPAALKSWLRQPSRIKPGARMPAFDTIGEQELDLIAAYLGGLR